MASRAPVLIDLMVTDPTRQLESTGLAAVHASQGLDRAEGAALDLDQALARLGTGATRAGRAIGDLGAGLSALPGPLGRVGQLVGDAGDVFEKMANPLGLVVGGMIGATAAIGGFIVGSVALVSASGDLIDRLDKIGRTDVITTEQREQLENARNSFLSLGDAGSELALILAASVGPAVEDTTQTLIGLTLAANEATGGLLESVSLTQAFTDGLLGAIGGLTGVNVGLVASILGNSGVVEALRQAGEAYTEAGANARTAAEGTDRYVESLGRFLKTANDIKFARAVLSPDDITFGSGSGGFSSSDVIRKRAARSDVQIGSGLGAGFSSSEVLGAGLKADIAAFGAASDRMAAGLSSMLGPVEAADAAYAAQVAQIERDIQVTGDLTTGMILLSAAVDEHAQALAEARRVELEQAAATVQGGLAAISGNLGGALGALGPVGGILGSAIELGPDTVEILDSRLSEIGDNIVQLPETLAKVLFTLLGAGSDNAGEGVGRFLGAVGGAIGGFLVAGPAGVVPGATLGSAAGGGIGNALAGGRTSRDPVDRAMRRQARTPSVTINGIVTSNVLRSLADEVRRQGGPRGLRTSLGVP